MKVRISYEDENQAFDFRIESKVRTPQIEEKIAFAIGLIPQAGTRVRVNAAPEGSRIPLIRAIRTITNCPLKDASTILHKFPFFIEGRGHYKGKVDLIVNLLTDAKADVSVV